MARCAASSAIATHRGQCAAFAALRVSARSSRVARLCRGVSRDWPGGDQAGQTLATRPDIVGEEAARNLLTLQDQLPPVDFAAIRHEIESSFERPLESLFATFDPEPVGAASIAQVHRATTIDGRDVAVKILRPGVREKFAAISRLTNGLRPISKRSTAKRGGCARGW